MSGTATPAPSWHWEESDHWELQFHGLPRRFPWLNDQPPPPRKSYPNPDHIEFPILHVYHAVKAMVDETPDSPHDPRFLGFARQIDLGDDFNAAMERGDFIAAAGVAREWERTGHECAYVLFNKAFVLRQTGRPAEALDQYRRAAELAPECEMIWMCYGESCEEAGDKGGAIHAYQQARRILPNHEQATVALERLGALFRAGPHGKPDEATYLTKEELRVFFERDLKTHWDNPAMLRSVGGQVLHDGLFLDLALSALTRALELDPANAEAHRNLGVALRVTGRPAEALAPLQRAAELDRTNPWTCFPLAETFVDLKDIPAAWAQLELALKRDPNHKGSLQLMYLNRTDLETDHKELNLAEYSRPRKGWVGSWQGFLLAAHSAWKRDDRETAVRWSADAYKLAPGLDEVFLTYTGMLAACGENEWVAALTKPRLQKGETRSRPHMNFARALHAMGLRDEAVATCRRALAELTLTREERAAFETELDQWTGRFARGEVAAELHPGGSSLRRTIYSIREGKTEVAVFEAGSGMPKRMKLPVAFKNPRTEFDFTLEQRHSQHDPEQHALGTFTITEVEPEKIGAEPVALELLLEKGGHIVLCARQGQRKLGVTWSLYPPPRHEPAETL